MKMFCQIGPVALARALRKIVLPAVSPALSQNPSSTGHAVTFTATVSASSGTPVGTVTFLDNTTSTTLGTITLATAGSSQQASVMVTLTNPPQSHLIVATYNGNSSFIGSSATLTQTVVKRRRRRSPRRKTQARSTNR
jgi:hypothetical protein